MEAILRRIRDELLATDDTVCLQRARLVTEAYQRHHQDPPPLKRARALAHVLRNMDLDLTTNPIFAGNTSARPRAWMLIPEHGIAGCPQVELENPGLVSFLDGKIPPELNGYWAQRSFGGNSGVGHLAVDLHTVVHRGLQALIDEAESQNSHETDPERATYREAMQIGLQAVIDWSQRYAGAAQAAARAASCPQIRQAHLRVAEACRRVPAKPARNLFEGLQSIVLVHLAICLEGHGMSVSVGLPDRVLEPFIDDTFDPVPATHLIAAFMLKLTANSLFGRGSKTQAITIGGADAQGNDRCNALTLCFLDACDLVRVGDPHVFLRWHSRLSTAVKERAAAMLAAGTSMPLLVHDAPTVQGFVNAGVKPEDAWDYCVIGCNELGIPGRAADSAVSHHGLIQHLAMLNEMLLEHPTPDSVQSTEELLARLEERMRHALTKARLAGHRRRERMAKEMPTPFTSAMMRGCIQRGADLLVGMDYHFPGLYERGITNAANALAAIDQLVYQERLLALSELVEAMRNDFPVAALRARLLTAPKWGNDDHRADRWMLRLLEIRERVLAQIDAAHADPPGFVCHVVRSLHHLDGRRIAASPDGRRARTPVADSIGAQTGSAHAGPTALLGSVLKIDAARYYRGGYNLNITLSPAATTPSVVLDLVSVFFAKGGQELQINCYSASDLRAAQANPARYGDLLVRFAGLSTRFIDLSPAHQHELIERAEVMV